MTTYTKPAVRRAWAEIAGGADLADPGDSFAAGGYLIGNKPPRQYDNWVLNYVMAGVRYLCQNGLPEFDPAETYRHAATVLNGADGLVYFSLQDNNINHTPAASPTWWGPLQTKTAANGDNSSATATTAFVHNNYLPLGSAFPAISGTVSNSQVPLSAVQQWQGSLSIAFSQLAGTIFNGQVPLSAVQQWQGNLAIGWGQITGVKNADLVAGYSVSANGTVAGNTIPTYTSQGYLGASYLFQNSSNNEHQPVSQILYTDGSDNFLRKGDIAYVGGALNPTFIGPQVTSVLPGGVILKIGTVSGAPFAGVPLDVQVNFTTPFPNTCIGIFPCGVRSVTTNGQAIDGSNFQFNVSRFGASITIDSAAAGWFAIGY
jgi:hypothetical protein